MRTPLTLVAISKVGMSAAMPTPRDAYTTARVSVHRKWKKKMAAEPLSPIMKYTMGVVARMMAASHGTSTVNVDSTNAAGWYMFELTSR
jgi:hypothetical protein